MSIRKRTLITAEIGPNHNGKIRYAEKIVKKLSKLDIDFIKFQFADPDEVYSLNSFKADYQIKNDGKSSIKEMSKRNQLKLSEHIKLAKLCKKLKKQYVCTVFDLKSMKKLNANINMPYFKIASGETRSLDIIKYLSKYKKKIVISTGMSDFKELKKIIKILNIKKESLTLLYCVSSYPAINSQININKIAELKKTFKCNVGFSDHTEGFESSVVAVVMGANMIEKHVTLDKNLKGPDHSFSLNLEEFSEFVQKIRNTEKILNKKKFIKSKNEKKIQLMAMKSLVFKKNLKKNHILKEEDIIFKRPGTGINPFKLRKYIGHKLKRNVLENTLINKNDFF